MGKIEALYGVLTKLNQTDKGWQITFLLDGPPSQEILEGKLRERFALAVVREKPSDDKRDAAWAVAEAGRLCRVAGFQEYLLGSSVFRSVSSDTEAEMLAANALRDRLHITSRKQIGTHLDAQRDFREILSHYEANFVTELFGDDL